jgi:hypothetical protein
MAMLSADSAKQARLAKSNAGKLLTLAFAIRAYCQVGKSKIA